ncbi:helix-turn-helix domain-containing protein [Pararhodobacter sp. SW119]|uniref:helix-turn-helix transcriptional regulator n=1 Tax=Pararhodobacter sp. SW119 TaxID=2780075 RepID=UPI001AE018F0|nr:helix-turn-helix domain-containing protein [Pararhodobacter sp. SW119]
MTEKLYTVEDLCDLLTCSKSTIWRWVAEGSFPKPIKIGGITRWEPNAVRERLSAAPDSGQPDLGKRRRANRGVHPTPRRKISRRSKLRPTLSL